MVATKDPSPTFEANALPFAICPPEEIRSVDILIALIAGL